MRFFNPPQRVALPLVLATLMTGCSANAWSSKAPASSQELPVPGGVGTETLFSCVEATVQTLGQANSHWRHPVTVRDVAGGRMETGDFNSDNVIGFRLKLGFKPNAPSASVTLKGAGPYFSDLGVKAAAKTLVDETGKCLMNKPAA